MWLITEKCFRRLLYNISHKKWFGRTLSRRNLFTALNTLLTIPFLGIGLIYGLKYIVSGYRRYQRANQVTVSTTQLKQPRRDLFEAH